MSDSALIISCFTVAALLAIAIGVIGPALAMGKAISQALEALAPARGGKIHHAHPVHRPGDD